MIFSNFDLSGRDARGCVPPAGRFLGKSSAKTLKFWGRSSSGAGFFTSQFRLICKQINLN